MTSPTRSAPLLLIAAAALASFAACRSDDEPNPGGGKGGSSGFGGGSGGSGNTGNGGSSGSGTGGTAGTSTGGSGGSAGGGAVTISDITTGVVAADQDVTVVGAVVMSREFLISQTASGSCLWGVFVSAPGITETAANSGIIALSYGDNATSKNDGGKAFCPILGEEPTGSGIPDDIAPGDVVDIAGKTSYFAASGCTAPKQRQLVSSTLTKTGTAAVPTPHALAASEIASLAGNDTAFHDMWGGVKVRITNVTATPQGDAGTSITNQFGQMVLAGSGLMVGDDVYYQGALKSVDACFDGPKYANAAQAFVSIDGFSHLDFCTWTLQPASKCGDLDPASEDCAIGTDSATGCTHY
jgi:hypothetical protein